MSLPNSWDESSAWETLPRQVLFQSFDDAPARRFIPWIMVGCMIAFVLICAAARLA